MDMKSRGDEEQNVGFRDSNARTGARGVVNGDFQVSSLELAGWWPHFGTPVMQTEGEVKG